MNNISFLYGCDSCLHVVYNGLDGYIKASDYHNKKGFIITEKGNYALTERVIKNLNRAIGKRISGLDKRIQSTQGKLNDYKASSI